MDNHEPQQDQGGQDAADVDASAVDRPSACLILSATQMGINRRQTVATIKRFAEGEVPPTIATKINKLFRLVAVCLNHLTADEISEFQAEKLTAMPQSYVEKADDRDYSKGLVEKIDEQTWLILKVLATNMV